MFYFSPVLVIEGATKGIVVGSLLVFASQFLVSLVLGRAFCGWVCPAAGLQEPLFAARDRRVRRGRWDWLKYAIWVPWLGGIAAAFAHGGGSRSVEPLYMTTHGVSIADLGNWAVYFSFVGLIVVLALTVGRRAFCHTVCWMAPFMVLGRTLRNALGWPSLRLVADAGRCRECLTCTTNCPMSLDVHAMVQRQRMEDAECILCGTCVDNCSRRAIRYAFASGTGRPQRTSAHGPGLD